MVRSEVRIPIKIVTIVNKSMGEENPYANTTK